MRGQPQSGVLLVDKPPGPSSFGVVRDVRRALGVRRIGHGGTLDPLASGLLMVCVGEATKVAGFFLDADKEYRAEVLLGVATDTYDAEGEVTETRDAGSVTPAAVKAALATFVGAIEQRPPAYSAVRQGGRRLYEKARAGEEVVAAPRQVTIHGIDLESCDLPRLVLAIRCSKGTYVRSLAHDLGQALGVGAHLTALRRLRSGRFDVADAVPLAEVDGRARAGTLPLLGLAEALGHLPRIDIDVGMERQARQGRPLRARDLDPRSQVTPGALAALVAPDGALVAVVQLPERPGGRVRSVRVFNR